MIVEHIGRIEVRADHLAVWLKERGEHEATARTDAPSFLISWRKPPTRRPQHSVSAGDGSADGASHKIERRARLVSAIAPRAPLVRRDRRGSVTDVQQIAAREKCSVRHVNMTISLAFLAPGLVRAAVEGRLPRGIGVERLRDAPVERHLQLETLELTPDHST